MLLTNIVMVSSKDKIVRCECWHFLTFLGGGWKGQNLQYFSKIRFNVLLLLHIGYPIISHETRPFITLRYSLRGVTALKFRLMAENSYPAILLHRSLNRFSSSRRVLQKYYDAIGLQIFLDVLQGDNDKDWSLFSEVHESESILGCLSVF